MMKTAAIHVIVVAKEGDQIRTAVNKAPMSNRADTKPTPNTDTRNMPLLKLEAVPDV